MVRPGFKPGWGRQSFPGRFDSGCLPPSSKAHSSSNARPSSELPIGCFVGDVSLRRRCGRIQSSRFFSVLDAGVIVMGGGSPGLAASRRRVASIESRRREQRGLRCVASRQQQGGRACEREPRNHGSDPDVFPGIHIGPRFLLNMRAPSPSIMRSQWQVLFALYSVSVPRQESFNRYGAIRTIGPVRISRLPIGKPARRGRLPSHARRDRVIGLSEASGKTLHAAAGQPFFSLVASLAMAFPQHAPVPCTGLRRCLPARLSRAMSDCERYG